MRSRLTLPQLWLALAVLLPALAALLPALSAVDLAYQLRAGSEMLDGAGIPRTDAWTFTVAGQPWLDQQWGAQLVLGAVWRATGWNGLLLLRSVLIGTAWGFLVLAIRRTAPNLPARTVTLLALGAFVVAATALALRPQLFGVALFCLVLALLADRRDHPGRLWAIPLVVVAWANLHGSFVLGPLLVGLAWLTDVAEACPTHRRTLAVVAASGLAMLVTPFGPDALLYAIRLSSNRELAARVTEWQPPALTDATGLLFFASLALVAAVLLRRLVRGQRRGLPAPWPAILTLGVFAALGLVAARGVAWWPAIAAVTVAGLLQGGSPVGSGEPSVAGDALPPPASIAPRANLANTLVLVLLVLVSLPLLFRAGPADPDLGLGAPRGLLSNAPPLVTGVLRSLHRREDRLWCPQTWASWFELAVPDLRVFVDSRIELFGSDVWADENAIAGGGPAALDALDRRGITIVVVSPNERALAGTLDGPAGGWRSTGSSDGAFTVYVRASRGLPPG